MVGRSEGDPKESNQSNEGRLPAYRAQLAEIGEPGWSETTVELLASSR